MKNIHISGLIPAVFTPMKADSSVNLESIAPVTEQLISEGVKGVYICGSTGEGPCLSREERMAVSEAYVKAVAGRVPTMVQVGHQSIVVARELAKHAQSIGADAISAIPPNYFKPRSLDNLVDALAEIATATPDTPFYYYHIPAVTGVPVDMVQLLEKVTGRIPNFVGVKYSHTAIFELQACLNTQEGRFNMLFGSDEMLLSALVVGVHGGVGSTYNFAAPLFNKIIEAHKLGELEKAKNLQANAVDMVRVLVAHGGNPAIKAMMGLIGTDCGGTRLPQQALNSIQIASLKGDMTSIGFFDWGRN